MSWATATSLSLRGKYVGRSTNARDVAVIALLASCLHIYATDGIRETTDALVADLSVDFTVMLTVQHFASRKTYARNAHILKLRYYQMKL